MTKTVYIWTGKEMKSWVHSLLHTIYIINLILLHQELFHLFVIFPRAKKKNKANNSAVPTTHRGLRQQKQHLQYYEKGSSHITTKQRRSCSWLTFPCILQSPVEGDPESTVRKGEELAVMAAGQDPEKACRRQHQERWTYLCLYHELLFPTVIQMYLNFLFQAFWNVKKRQIRTFLIMLLSLPHLNDSPKSTLSSWGSQQEGPKPWNSLSCQHDSLTNCY